MRRYDITSCQSSVCRKNTQFQLCAATVTISDVYTHSYGIRKIAIFPCYCKPPDNPDGASCKADVCFNRYYLEHNVCVSRTYRSKQLIHIHVHVPHCKHITWMCFTGRYTLSVLRTNARLAKLAQTTIFNAKRVISNWKSFQLHVTALAYARWSTLKQVHISAAHAAIYVYIHINMSTLNVSRWGTTGSIVHVSYLHNRRVHSRIHGRSDQRGRVRETNDWWLLKNAAPVWTVLTKRLNYRWVPYGKYCSICKPFLRTELRNAKVECQWSIQNVPLQQISHTSWNGDNIRLQLQILQWTGKNIVAIVICTLIHGDLLLNGWNYVIILFIQCNSVYLS